MYKHIENTANQRQYSGLSMSNYNVNHQNSFHKQGFCLYCKHIVMFQLCYRYPSQARNGGDYQPIVLKIPTFNSNCNAIHMFLCVTRLHTTPNTCMVSITSHAFPGSLKLLYTQIRKTGETEKKKHISFLCIIFISTQKNRQTMNPNFLKRNKKSMCFQK